MKIKGLLTKNKILKVLGVVIPVTLSFGLLIFLIFYPVKKGNIKISSFSFITSHESGIYEEGINFQIIPSNPFFEIRYTTDGSEPNRKSSIYAGGIKIDKSSVIKFGFFSNGVLEDKIYTKVFVFNKHTVPVVFLATDPINLWDPIQGIYVEGENEKSPNFTQKGSDWQKPAEFFYFDENGKLGLQMPVEIRISGGGTRYNSQKTLRICAKQEFGYKSINYDFFGEGASKQHKCILLRNSGNDWGKTLLRDVLGQSLVYDLGIDVQHHKTSVLYLNGEYWGIHNIREFYDDQYLKYKYGTKKESVVIIEPDRRRSGYPVVKNGNEGDEKYYLELLDNVNDYDYLKEHIDIDSYIDYFLIHLYTANDDWPDNNIRAWKLKTDEYPSMSLKPLDGKWRWLLYDLDSSLGKDKMNSNDINTLYFSTRKTIFSDNSKKEEKWPTQIIRTLLTNEDFVNSFINRYADLLNTNFRKETVLEKIETLKKTYEPEIPMHVSKWGGTPTKGEKPAFESLEKWQSNVQVIENFAQNRTKYERQHIVDYFNLSGTFKIIFNSDSIEGGTVKINTIDSNNKYFRRELEYFKDIPITIEAKPKFGWEFVSWGNDEMGKDSKQVVKFNKDIYLKPEFKLTWWGAILKKL